MRLEEEAWTICPHVLREHLLVIPSSNVSEMASSAQFPAIYRRPVSNVTLLLYRTQLDQKVPPNYLLFQISSTPRLRDVSSLHDSAAA